MERDDADDPWAAPADDPASELGPGLLGFFGVVGLHGLAWAASSALGLGFWFASFGVAQLLFLVPLVALLVWRQAPRPVVVGIFFGAALAFLVNVVWLLIPLVDASLV